MSDKIETITAIILAHNEAENIEHCLASVRRIPKVYVVDSGSTDATVEISRRYGAEVVHHAYANHASQWRWALETLPIATPWILTLDADFVVTDRLLKRMEKDLATLPESVSGIYLRHLYQFGWGLIRFGGTKKYWLRIVRRGKAQPDRSDLVDFRLVVDGATVTWPESFVEYNRKDDNISTWLQKQDKFALRLAVEEELRRRKLLSWDNGPCFFGTTDQRFAWLRDRWLKLPLFLRPVMYFLYRYVAAGGFLDGRAGFLYHFLQGFWLRVLVDWKTIEVRHLKLDDAALLKFSQAMLLTRSGSPADAYDVMQAGDTSPS